TLSSAYAAEKVKLQDGEFFETRIRPVLVEKCYKCHSAEAKKAGKLKGGLLLDSRAGLLKGGDSGAAVVPGKPADSLLLKALRYADEALRMPPKGKLPNSVVADFEKWIALGAPDPRETVTGAKGPFDLVVARKHWAFRPIQGVPPPAVKNH